MRTEMHRCLPENFSGGLVNWRVAALHYVAKALGLLVKVEGFPYGTTRNYNLPSGGRAGQNCPAEATE